MPNWLRTSLLLALVLCAVLPAAGCRDNGPIRLGFLGSLTGRGAGLGIDGRNGFLLAVEQANAAGGIAGRPVEPLIIDDQMDPQKAREAVAAMTGAGVRAIIGPMTSQIAVQVVPDINRARIPLIAPTVSTNQLSDLDDYFFRVYYSNAQAAAILAERMARDLGITRLAAIYDLDNRAYTEDWLQVFAARFGELGGQVVATVPYTAQPGTLFLTIAEQALASRPEGLMILANAVDTAMFCQQVAKLSGQARLFATGWSNSDDLLHLGGQAVEGMVLVQSADLQSGRHETRAFRKAFRERFQSEPNFPALHAYDAARIALAALKASGGVAGDLKPALLATRLDGAQGEVRFTRNGDCLDPPVYLARISGGAFVPLPKP